MLRFYDNLQKYHNYTDYQIKLVNYALKSLAAEISKFLIISAFFLVMGQYREFLVSAALLLFFRRYNGGLHCNTYIGCLIFSFGFFLAAVCVLPTVISLPNSIGFCIMIGLTIFIPLVAPIKSKYHAEVEPAVIRRYKRRTLAVLIGLTLLYGIFPENNFIICCFWMTLLHFGQLFTAYLKKQQQTEMTNSIADIP